MPLILIMLPLIFQIIFGRKAVGRDIKWSFGSICLISFFSQILLTVLAFNLIVYNLEKNNNRCGQPLVGLVMFSFLFTLILFIAIFIQYRAKKYYEEE